VQGGYDGEGNIDADPLFGDAANDDYHLRHDSPCIDTGDNFALHLPEFDFEGDLRILDGDGNGLATVDMGVDEFVYQIPVSLEVEIDITPAIPHNVIRLDSGSLLPVAILTTDEFDAAAVNPETVLFAGAEPVRWAMDDVDRDDDLDLVLYFQKQDLNLDETSTEATLTGETYGGIPIEGTDRVKVK
jgi:hypothetical protein